MELDEQMEKLLKLAYRRASQDEYQEIISYMGYKNYPLFSIDEVRDVFRYYFETYELCMGKVHPNINLEQAAQIITAMPYITDSNGKDIELFSSEYVRIIDKHFITQYKKCDYNINHFFSGDIRLFRYREEFC